MIRIPERNASGAYLREVREGMGLGLPEAAELIGYSAARLAVIERDGIRPGTLLSRAKRICKGYGIGLQTLFDKATTPATD